MSRFNGVLAILLAFACYFVAGRIGLSTPFTSGNVSPVWPASGVALALVLLFGNRVWPGIFAGAFLTNLLSPIPHVAALVLGIGNTLAALTGGWLLRRCGFDKSLLRLRDVLQLLLLGAVASTLVSASCGVTVLFATGVQPWSSVVPAWLMYWLGDAMGIVLVAPFVLNLAVFRELRTRKLEFVALVAMVTAASLAIFSNVLFHSTEMDVLSFAVFPLVIWGALRMGIPGSCCSTLIIAIVATSETAYGYGPFAGKEAIINAGLLQVFFAVISISGLTLAALAAERETAERERIQSVQATVAREARLRLAAIVESSDDAIFAKDITGVVTDWNRAAERLYGFSSEEMVGEPVSKIVPQEYLDELRLIMLKLAQGATIERLETIRQRKDGTRVYVSLTISPMHNEAGVVTGASVIARDITQRKLAEEALRRAEKLAATGRLAASIAHEINNPLASLTNLLYLIQSQPALDVTTRGYLTAAEAELRRTAHITHQMLTFHRDSEHPVSINLPALLDTMIDAYSFRIRKAEISIERDYKVDADIEGHPGELRQVFTNFLFNAIEALSPGGKIKIRLSAARAWNNGSRRGVRIVFADNGTGIALDKRPRLFEPFFTTKGERGTGLGLWVSSGIVQKYGGYIRYFTSTRPGRSGTVFSIFLSTAVELKSAEVVRSNTA